jgi:hypothetical protein
MTPDERRVAIEESVRTLFFLAALAFVTGLAWTVLA